MPELVWMYLVHAGLSTPSPEHLRDPRFGQASFRPQPQPVKLFVFVSSPRPQIAIHSLHGLAPQRKGATATTLTSHLQLVELQIEILVQPEVGNLGQSSTGIDEDEQDGCVPPVIERSSRADPQEAADGVVGDNRHGALVELRWAHPLHGVAIDFAFIAGRCGRRSKASELGFDEGLEVLPAMLEAAVGMPAA